MQKIFWKEYMLTEKNGARKLSRPNFGCSSLLVPISLLIRKKNWCQFQAAEMNYLRSVKGYTRPDVLEKVVIDFVYSLLKF